MARKRKAPMPTATEAPTRPVRLDLPAEVHRLLRLVAADQETSMSAFARELLARELRAEAKRRGIKG